MVALWTRPRLRDLRTVPSVPVEVDESHPLAAGLVSLWIADSTRLLSDIGPGGNNLTVSGGAPFTPGGRGVVMSGNGAGQYLTAPDSPSLRVGLNLTIAGLLSFNAFGPGSGWQSLLRKEHASNGGESYALDFSNNALRFLLRDAVNNPFYVQPTLSSITTDTWHHYAGAASPSGMSVFLDGVSQASNGGGYGSIQYDGSNLTIGYQQAAGTSTNGFIGCVALYSRTFSTSEVAWLAAEPFAMLRPRA